jgi:hypothetical protein
VKELPPAQQVQFSQECGSYQAVARHAVKAMGAHVGNVETALKIKYKLRLSTAKMLVQCFFFDVFVRAAMLISLS